MSDADISQLVVKHIVDILAGECSITQEEIAAQGDVPLAEILSGLKYLHEDLMLRQELQRTAEEELRRSAEQLAEQNERLAASQGSLQKLVAELSSLVIRVWDGVLMVPIVGTLGRNRADALMGRLLERLARDKARYLILDLTGVPGLEADSADALARIARTAQLLGATVTIAGLRPEAAAAMSGIHFDMSRISAVRNVQEALAACFEQARREAGARGGLARLRGGKEHPIGD